MENIKLHIKNNSFSSVYLIFGKEDFFRTLNQKLLTNSIVDDAFQMMNVSIFEEKNCDILDIINICDTPPFMSEKRLVIIKNVAIFKDIKKNERDTLNDYITNLPSSTILILSEESINKNTKLYKTINKLGSSHDVDDISEDAIIKYIQNNCQKNNYTISPKTATYLIKYVGSNMQTIINELDKVTSFFTELQKKGNGQIITNQEITISQINQICTKSIESKVFDLIDAIAYKNLNAVLEIYQNLLHDKVTPYQILNLISRQFRIIIKVKNVNMDNHFQIAKHLNLNPYSIKGAMSQAQNFDNKQLLNALNDCLDTDIKIKTGLLPPEIGVEMLIIKYTSF